MFSSSICIVQILTLSLLHILPSATVGDIYPSVLPPPAAQDTLPPLPRTSETDAGHHAAQIPSKVGADVIFY